MNNILNEVATLDLSKFINGDKNDRIEFSNNLGTSFNKTGLQLLKILVLKMNYHKNYIK